MQSWSLPTAVYSLQYWNYFNSFVHHTSDGQAGACMCFFWEPSCCVDVTMEKSDPVPNMLSVGS